MLVVFVVLIAIVAGAGWFMTARSRRRIRRYEQRNHALYLKTKRESTIAGWFRIKRTPRLTYMPAETERSDISEG